MVKIVLTVLALTLFFGSTTAFLSDVQARGGDDPKGTWNKYEEPYQYWFTMPNP